MSSVLHPVGPEPEETYWARRVAVLIALGVVVGLVVALVLNGTSTGSAVSAAPAPPPATAPPATSPSPSASPTPSAGPSASPSASEGAPASASPSAAASSTPSPRASSSASASKSPSREPTTTGPVVCRPDDLRATLTGRQRLAPEQRSTFTLSLINGSDTTCVVRVTPENFELKIYSGTDRIWSSDDCATAVEKIETRVKAEDAVEWTMTWNGQRSRPGCEDRAEVPRPGTYFATAQLKGAKPVQLRMILGG